MNWVRQRHGTWRTAASLLAIGVITVFCVRIVPVNATTAPLVYLLAILAIATAWGLAEATVASLAAVLCFNFFFLPPVYTFTIADPQNWVALLVFLATSVVGSQLSGHARVQAKEALSRQREMEQLYALSRAILLAGVKPEAIKQIAFEIAQIFVFPAVAIYDRDTAQKHGGGPQDLTGIEDQLRETALQGTQFRDEAANLIITPIQLGGEPIGALAVHGRATSDAALQAISYLVAIAMERIRSDQAASRAEASRESERLKSTLLDAIAHEFQTPLTSIKAASTALLSAVPCDPAARDELAAIVDEEADRLSRLVSEAIQMARLEAGQIQVRRENHTATELVKAATKGLQAALEGRALSVQIAADLPPVGVDFELLELAIRQVLGNALKFSPPRSPLEIRAAVEGGNLVLSIADHGPGIPEREQRQIFEKYYRGASTRKETSGSGLGLAIARDILRAHGGDIRLESSPGEGAEFSLLVPLTPAEVAS